MKQAVSEKDKRKAAGLWRDAMKTCYACHRGTDDFPVLRKFTPLESIHSHHRRAVTQFNFKESCSTCHEEGATMFHGYGKGLR